MLHYLRIIKLIIIRYASSIWVMIISKLDKGLKIGRNCKFTGVPYLRPKPGSRIVIGNNCSFNSSKNSNLIGINRKCMISTLNEKASIFIEDNCGFSGTVIAADVKIIIKSGTRCGANALITDTDWHLDDTRAGKPKPIIIEENVWLGEGVKVLKGVTIGKNSVIGAGSVVTKSIPDNVIAAGNPCKIIKQINNL